MRKNNGNSISIIPMLGFGDVIATYPHIIKMAEEYDRVEVAVYYWKLFEHIENVFFLFPRTLTDRPYPSGEAAWGRGPPIHRRIDAFTNPPKSWFANEHNSRAHTTGHIESFEARSGIHISEGEYDTRFHFPSSLRYPSIYNWHTGFRSKQYLLVHPPTLKNSDQAIERVPDLEVFTKAVQYARDATKLPLVLLQNTVTDKALLPHLLPQVTIDGLQDFERETIDLCQNAAGIITYPCFLFWAALLSRRPLLSVFGGGNTDSIEWQLGDKVPVGDIFPIIPDNYCYCEPTDKRLDPEHRRAAHQCDKAVSEPRIRKAVENFARRINDP